MNVPVGGCYRLIDIPMSNRGINKIFVLTQFNSASLNHHIARTYFGNGINFGDGFVELKENNDNLEDKRAYEPVSDTILVVKQRKETEKWTMGMEE
ncbi:hypothetical protein G4B88_030270 [Cannabis sativa]|uniref:Uncharacterized protein n=1 Tax=Cannabis sativa TaxID=3483 RepID=A0A7J6GEP8_CANSA|nr:hypothetical protein G4B88_030270 [Cannabis sativa]